LWQSQAILSASGARVGAGADQRHSLFSIGGHEYRSFDSVIEKQNGHWNLESDSPSSDLSFARVAEHTQEV
jgi:hypothetical protein